MVNVVVVKMTLPPRDLIVKNAEDVLNKEYEKSVEQLKLIKNKISEDLLNELNSIKKTIVSELR